MMETDSPSKIFLGVRFVLFCFDPLTKNKVKSKLVSGGGVDAGQYNENCTHVIVDKIVYDDPICVAARNDGKTVVTGLWVDHSFDIGMPVDSTSVMYQPLRDLNGIPGAKNLIMCLTGYQRQDRDDIMTMVGLMGAQFSKPLVANKVTHLVCYKFEGEKYELANKMRKIKLVNHRWLEDCLKDWKLLSEDNYNKSGYELEMMEAEAKDSEEEAEGPGVKPSSSENAYRSPHNLKARTPSGCALPKSTGEARKISNNFGEPEVLSSIVSDKEVLTTPGRSRADHASSFDNIRISEVSGHLDVGSFKVAASFELPEPQYKTLISIKTGNDLESVSRSAERQSHSDASCTRKTPQRSPSSIFSVHSGDIRGSPKSMLGQLIDVSSAKVEDANDLTNSPCAGDFIDKEASSRKKQKTDVSCSRFRSQKINHDAQACVTGSPSVISKSGGLEPPSLVDGLSKIDNNYPSSNHGYSAHDMISMNAAQNLHTNVSAAKSSKFRQKSSAEDQVLLENMTLEAGQNQKANTKTPEPSFRELREDNLARHDSGFYVAERSEHIVVEAAEPQNLLQDGVPHNRKSETEKSDSLSNLDVLHLGNDNSITKPAGKKMVSKKTLGSRPKLTSKPNQKGSIYLNASSAQINPADDLTGGKEGAENESFTNANEFKTSFASVKVTAASNMETELATRSGDNIENKIDFMDDETEAPEEKENCDNLLGGQQAEVIGLTHKAYNKREMILEGTFHGADKSPTCVHDGPVEGKNEVENAVELQKKGGSISSEDSVERKGLKEQRQLSGKTKSKPVPPVRKAESKEVQDMEESCNGKNIEEKVAEKENAEPLPVGKAKSRIISKKKSKSSAEAEKENKLAVDADQSLSRSEDHVGKTIAKSNETTMKINQKSRKSNPTSTPCGEVTKQVKTEPLWFILSGHRLQRKEFQQVIRHLKGKFCRDSHQWSYQATHFIAPDPIRRTEKFFAAAASGRWILKTDYPAACSQAGKFLAEEPYEWHKKGLSEDGAINLEAPRRWRLLRERTGHGAFYGMRIIIYGECITPPLDTLKRVVKAGDGTILATSPPYTRFLTSGVDYAVISPGMLRVDIWVQEFLKHKIPCVVADYLVEYVCKPGYSLEKHVLYNTNEWAENSFSNLLSKAEEIVEDLSTSNDCSSDEIACEACGFRDRAEVMLICGDECGSVGCGVGKHIDCCNPPLENIPEEDWFCPKCSGKRTSTSPRKKRTKKKASSRKAK